MRKVFLASWLNVAICFSAPVEYLSPEELKPFKDVFPVVADWNLQKTLMGSDTVFYDQKSMPHVYQDSVNPILGVRANDLGIKIAVEGDRIFDAKGFHFPFKQTAGTDATDNLYVLNFWAPPKTNNHFLPVVLYKDDTTRWRWIFPVGTMFGEILFLKDPQGQWLVFEIRTRSRYLNGWTTQLFRPFDTAESLAQTIQQKKPDWQSYQSLRRLVDHLYNSQTLQAKSIKSDHFPQTFTAVDGALDYLPDFQDPALVTNLLRNTPFVPMEGKVWKRMGSLETYAPSTRENFSIIPKNYEGGLFPVNEVSCNRCHDQVGRQIGEFNFNTLLYGEIWGEDRIFSWHLFDPSGNFNGAFQENRVLSKKLKDAGLIESYQPGSVHSAEVYKELPRPFKITWK